jgi:hypothetical protein
VRTCAAPEGLNLVLLALAAAIAFVVVLIVWLL